MNRSWRPDPDRAWLFIVDVIGVCNLRCPSCPVGNSPQVQNPSSGYMEPELLDSILRKATSECSVGHVALYNWTEPLLHPALPEMIRTVRRHGVDCGLSSNLNLMRDMEAVLAAEPNDLKISLSGFEQATYGITHRRGDIERVKSNMAELARLRDQSGSSTKIWVNFHRYLGNHDDEARMRDYAKSLGFGFEPTWAYLMPLEKVLAYAEPSATDARLTDEDRDLIGRLALPLDEALAASRRQSSRPCKLRDEQMAINWRGEVMLCCTAYDERRYKLGSYLDTPLEELQAQKYRDPSCGSCMSNGIHQLFNYETRGLDALAFANVARHHPDVSLAATQVPKRGLLRRSWKAAKRTGRRLARRLR